MKKIINGVAYNTDKCETLCEYTRYQSSSNLPSAYMRLLRANDGKILEWRDATGQDGYVTDYLRIVDPCERDDFGDMLIDSYEPDDEQLERLVELGIVKEA